MKFFVILLLIIPTWIFAESNLTPAQPLETNPLAQQFTPSTKNSNTQMYVTQFAQPGAQQQPNNAPSLDSLSSWVNNPGQVLTNGVINRYGVGMQVGF